MKIESTTGHYGITVTGDVQAAKLEELAALGLAQGILYRGVFADLRETTGAKRKMEDSAPYDAAKAAIVKAAIAKAVVAYLVNPLIVVDSYDGAEAKAPKFAREKKKFAEKESTAAGLEAWLKAFAGYTGATHGDDGEYSVEALAAAKAAIDKFLAENI
jgi:hypothetical protein